MPLFLLDVVRGGRFMKRLVCPQLTEQWLQWKLFYRLHLSTPFGRLPSSWVWPEREDACTGSKIGINYGAPAKSSNPPMVFKFVFEVTPHGCRSGVPLNSPSAEPLFQRKRKILDVCQSRGSGSEARTGVWSANPASVIRRGDVVNIGKSGPQGTPDRIESDRSDSCFT